MTKDGRIRMFEIVQYDEYWKPNKALEWLNKIACDYLAVKHDKDIENGVPKKLHYHIAVRLKDARTLDDIAKNCEVEKQYIAFVNKFKDKCAYLFHLTSNARKDHKHEYNDECIIGSKHISYEQVKAISIDYDNKVNRSQEVKQLLLDYGECKITKQDVINALSSEDYHNHYKLFENMKKFRQMKVRNREMEVMYITGGAGLGKTTFAKYFARLQKYDVFVSGSGKDVLDGYDKEECIILDDLRADVFTKAELFKLTDNNTNSSVKSRYANKDISFCKLMIITSIKAPHELYNWEDDIQESFKQFARRLNYRFLYIADNTTIWDCYYDEDGYRVEGKKKLPFTMNEVFTMLGIERNLGKSRMDVLLDMVKDKVEEDQKKRDEDLPF